ncbi:MAG: hypothetical protein JW809_10295 [Pirellulales bacterium]|nr:hypothetical protein [Pirellulales bacterium]
MKTFFERCSCRVLRLATFAFVGAAVFVVSVFGTNVFAAELRWYKGCTHAHSYWSDGDEFPEMVVDWFKSHGYDFFALSDHNVLMEGARWVPLKTDKRRIPDRVVEACQKRFGDDWVDLRGQGDQREVRLKTYDEIRKRLEEPGRFLMIQGEEITGECNDKQVHVNAINLVKLIEPQQGKTVAETIRADLAAVRRQSEETGRTILAHVNHPNWKHYDITADDLAEVVEAKFFELCNNSDVNHHGDATHPSTERLWDLANTIRLAKLKAAPLLGVGTDDSHHYQHWQPDKLNPGRAWIVVRADSLAIAPILAAMERGDFYASTGVVLKDVAFSAEAGALRVEVDPKPGAKYTIEFIGTKIGVDPKTDPAKVGQVFARHEGTSAEYRLQGDELYVRAAIRSDRKLENPPADGVTTETAWTQPVGWQGWVTGTK